MVCCSTDLKENKHYPSIQQDTLEIPLDSGDANDSADSINSPERKEEKEEEELEKKVRQNTKK